MNWVLIILVYAGPMSEGDSVALTSVEGFSSQATCAAAGNAAVSRLSPGYKKATFACVSR